MRSAEFDREEVLRAAIQAFVIKGYSKTSMQDLKQATGLHPGSIYCAFENKEGLLIEALKQYSQDCCRDFEQFFLGNKTVLAGLKKYLDNTVKDCSSSGTQKICLSQQAQSELAAQVPAVDAVINKNFTNWKHSFVMVFEQALAAGEVDNSRTPTQRTSSLIMGIYGLRTYAQTRPSAQVLAELGQQLFDDVCR